MKHIITNALFLVLILQSCADGSDPDTLTRDELSPPLNLVTVTGSEAVELRWNAQNFEDELQGYHVFMLADKSIAQIVADGTLPEYPAKEYTAELLRQASIPRCKENNSFYALFGVEAGSDESCESSLLLQDDTDTEDEKSSILAAKQTCYDPENPETNLGNDNISVLKVAGSEYSDGEGIQRCLIKGLTNGSNYTFFVVAVLGDDFDEISWSSNLVDDTPAPALHDADITIPTQNYLSVTISLVSAPSATVSAAANCPYTSNDANNFCSILRSNNEATDADNRIYIARDNFSDAYPQRLALSTSSNGNIQLIGRGPMTIDPLLGADTIASRIPGDAAITWAEGVYYDKGTVLGVYENSVFDFVLTNGGSNYYGKLILHSYNYASTTDKSSDLTVKLSVIFQPAAENTNYLY